VVVQEIVMPFKDRLKQLRNAAGLTQQALAYHAGLSIASIIALEAGRTPNPRMKTLKALAKALGVTVDALVTEEGEESPPDPGEPKKGKGRKGGKP
jgi:transcriptional regulator with XRE-family HTH domain